MIDLISLLNKLETDKPAKVLFSSKDIYNYCGGKINYNLFLLVCNNFFGDMGDVNNIKINTIKYWFLHNLSILLNNNKELITDLSYNAEEIEIVVDYFRVVQLGKERRSDGFIFLPIMNLFSSWCNVTNNEKIQVHHKIFMDMIYLDDNYFFLINYFRIHNKKFISSVFKNKYEMEKGNNIMIHLFRSATFKNNSCALKNFMKIVRFLFVEIWEDKFMEILMKKNNAGNRAINLLTYLREEFYEFIVEKIMITVSMHDFMEKYFSALTKNISHSFQLQIILENFKDDLIKYQMKFENLYQKLLKNKKIMFYEKFEMIQMMRERDLIEIVEEDKEKLGRKLWEKLHLEE